VGIHPKNLLNDLTVKEWTKARKSWFIQDGVEPEWNTKKKHPATYPSAVASRFIEFFTRRGQTVLDPFAGSGSTIIAARQLGRKAIGIELYQHNIDIAVTILDIYYPLLGGEFIVGDCLTAMKSLMTRERMVDYIIFSPPYSDTLHKSSGGATTRHKERMEEGLDTEYGDDERDLGNMTPDEWLDAMVEVAKLGYDLVPPGRYMTIIIQNEVRVEFVPLAWRLALAIDEQTDWVLKPEQIWCQDNKALTPTGHPKTFLTANHHHYCLHFWKEGEFDGERVELDEPAVIHSTDAMDFF
jgi:hypothetical protein